MEVGLGENLVRLYERLAQICQGAPGGEDLLAEAEDNSLAACTTESRNAYDSFLIAASLALQQPGRALAALEKSERMQPENCAPSLHLVKVYAAAGRPEDALAACERAMARAKDVEKLAVYSAREQVQRTNGDNEGAQQTAREARDFAETLGGPAGRALAGRPDEAL